MIEDFQIKGGAGDYEAAALAAVVEQIRRRRVAARARRPKATNRMSAWMRAASLTAVDPMPRPDPGLNGDSAPNRPSEQPWLDSSILQRAVR